VDLVDREEGDRQRVEPGEIRPSLDEVTTGNYPEPMKVVGIKQLKARLSEYVRLAKAGETVLVTERDEVVAELRPARRQTPVADRLEELLEALAAAGEITRAAQPKGDWTWRSRGLGLPPGTAQGLLEELRQERA
jgi:antitoxin (DNA-binding transcriptional repressor) of toxin-antitoxin stability system